MSVFQFIAVSAPSLEEILTGELRALGIKGATTTGGSRFSGSIGDAYRVCMWSRVAHRVLLSLDQFAAPTEDALFDGIRRTRWPDHLHAPASFAVRLRAEGARLSQSTALAERVKTTILRQYRELDRDPPRTDPRHPDMLVEVAVSASEARIAIDLSGGPLYPRIYRGAHAADPLFEGLAAALLLEADWPELAAQGCPFVDPMCASGVLAIEAAMIAADKAPGLLRTSWGFTKWPHHQPQAWQEIRDEAVDRATEGLLENLEILAYDNDRAALESARSRHQDAGLDGRIQFRRREVAECMPPDAGDLGLVATAPPWALMSTHDPEVLELYSHLGKLLRDRFQGWDAAVLVNRPELRKRLGLRAKNSKRLVCGRDFARLFHFRIDDESSALIHSEYVPRNRRTASAEALAQRIRTNLTSTARWRRREGISCFRVYANDLRDYPFIIDVYQGRQRYACIQPRGQPGEQAASFRMREVVSAVRDQLDIEARHCLCPGSDSPEQQALIRELGNELVEVREDGLRFLVRFGDCRYPGLPPVTRDVRRLLRKRSGHKHFLHLFCHAAAATVHAAKGGADSTTSIDIIGEHLAWADRNLSLNNLSRENHHLIESDLLSWLQQARRAGKRFSLILLSPMQIHEQSPQGSGIDIQRDHGALLRAAVHLLEPFGQLFFTTDLPHFRLDTRQLGRSRVDDIARDTIPRDFFAYPGEHRCWLIRRPRPKQSRG